MSNVAHAAGTEEAVARQGYPAGSIRFDWIASLLALLVVCGLFLDGWAHSHGRVDNTFFTPWHGLLYSGVALTAGFLGINQLRNSGRGYAFTRSLPKGYWLSLIGAGMFLAGGVFDMFWHEAFGFEVNLETLLSPAHLWLATSGLLMVSGALRSVWSKYAPGAHGWIKLAPAILVTTLAVVILSFFTEFAAPISNMWMYQRQGANNYNWQTIGAASVLVQSALIAGGALLLIRRWVLPFGSFALMLTVNTALMSVFDDTYAAIPIALVAGLVLDAIYSMLKPSSARQRAFYAFAFLLPALYFLTFFVGLQISTGIGWTIHLWLGAIIMAGAVGLGLSMLMIPPFESAKT